MRGEREDLKKQVDRLKDVVRASEKKWQQQASTIQALEKQLGSRKRGHEEEEGNTKREVTAALQSQVEKRFRALIGDFDMIFKSSGYVFDPAATSSEEENDPVQVPLAETKADLEKGSVKANVEIENAKHKREKEHTTAPEMNCSNTKTTENKVLGGVAKGHPATLPVKTLSSSIDGTSSTSEHGE